MRHQKRIFAGLDRRQMLVGGAALALSLPFSGSRAAAQAPAPGMRRIPSTGEQVPAVGLGTWITFNVGSDPVLLERSANVMEAFFGGGGRVIDSSPMYGSSQDTLGYGFEKLGRPEGLFAADKVWTSSATEGPEQMEESRREWSVPRFSLMQVHNLRAHEAHLPMLFDKKAAGEIDHVGVTTSHGRRHGALEALMKSEPLDFVQVTYNVLDREVEERILPLAQERGIGVVVNRPFRRGALTRRLEGTELPPFAADIGAATWAQYILKFILSHPAITVAIPATTVPAHASENMAASSGPMPDPELRERMSEYVRQL